MSNLTVHTGTWTNWSYGKVGGATLSLIQRDATYLIAFLALFVGVAGSHLWSLLCYIIFQLRSDINSRGALHHQKQAILRNYQTDTSAMWKFIVVGWQWRQKGKSWLSILPWVAFALLHLSAITTAGIFSSRIVRRDNIVLVKGPTCGFWFKSTTGNTDSALEKTMAFEFRYAKDFATASTLADLCVDQDHGTNGADCQAYGPRMMNYTTTTQSLKSNDTACPFEKGMCANDTVVTFDSGYLSSHFDYGINAKPEDRIEIRSVMSCAPLTREGFFEDLHPITGNSTTGLGPISRLPNEAFEEYFYGANQVYGWNSSFAYSNASSTRALGVNDPLLFKMYTGRSILQGDIYSDFSLIPQLNRTDADVLLFFLMPKRMHYTRVVTDPWFSAAVPFLTNIPGQGGFREVTLYESTYGVSPMGCTYQQQYCNPKAKDGRVCTPLSSYNDRAFNPMKLPSLRPRQKNTIVRLSYTDVNIDPTTAISQIGGKIILGNKFATGRIPPFEDNQWIKELGHIFGTALAAKQITQWRYAGGYDGDLLQNIQAPLANETWACDSQLIASAKHTSFSVLGLALVLSLGLLIITLNLSLSAFLAWLEDHNSEKSYARLEWDFLETTEMQRAHYGFDGKQSVKDVAGLREVTQGSVLKRKASGFSFINRAATFSPISPSNKAYEAWGGKTTKNPEDDFELLAKERKSPLRVATNSGEQMYGRIDGFETAYTGGGMPKP